MESEEDEDASSSAVAHDKGTPSPPPPPPPDEKNVLGSTTTKGKGLKKWRRIQRKDVVASPKQTPTSPSVEEDLHRFLKRDSRRLAPALRGSGSPSSPGGGDDSDSRSSTAASAPKFRFNNNNNNPGAKKAARAAGFRKDNFLFTANNMSYSNGGGGVGHLTFGADNTSQSQTSDQHSNSNSDDAGAPTSHHLLADSILSLQAVHLALQQEIRNFEKIGKESVLLRDETTCDFPMDTKFHSAASKVYETNSSGQSRSLPLEEEFVKIYDQAHIFERKLEEAMTMLKTKETKVAELEGILAERELGSNPQEKCREIEAELEDLFRQKIEAEVECLTMRKTSEELKAVSENEIALITRQNKILHKLGDADQVNLLDSSSIVVSEEIPKMKKSRMCKYAICFFVQLVLLFLAFRLLFLQLWPSSTTSVPT